MTGGVSGKMTDGVSDSGKMTVGVSDGVSGKMTGGVSDGVSGSCVLDASRHSPPLAGSLGSVPAECRSGVTPARGVPPQGTISARGETAHVSLRPRDAPGTMTPNESTARPTDRKMALYVASLLSRPYL